MTATPTVPPTRDAAALAAGMAAASVLPASEALTALDPQAGTDHVVALFAGAAVADLVGMPGRLAVLVGEELVVALQGSPLGGLDLAAAVQPAIDAAAAALGTAAQAARTVALDLVLSDVGAPFTVVPLAGGTIAAALLLSDQVLAPRTASVADPGLAGFATTAPAPTPVRTTAPTPAPALAAASAPAAGRMSPAGTRGIELLHGVDMEVTVELGRTRMPVRELLALAPGAVLELDRAAGSPADLLVNGRLIARGEVVVVDEDFGLRVTEILDESAG
jgi:flagellar motor switch protein FliN/FliY